MASLRQIAANRANAQKSTGPVTEAGKNRSRRNSLKHGLSGSGVVLPDETADALAARAEEWRSHYAPTSTHGEWFFRQIVACSVIIDACQAHDRTLTEYAAIRAELNWDADRAAAVEKLAEALPRKPERIARQLRRTKHGAVWMLGQWSDLKDVLDRGDEWTDADRALALDLLGAPHAVRDGTTALADPAALTLRELNRLVERLDNALDEIDAFERTATEAGVPAVIGPDLRLVRRYEAACWRRMGVATRSLKQESAGAPVEPVAPPPPPTPEIAEPAPRRAMTEEEYAAGLEYDRSLFQKLMESRAQKAAEAAQAAAEGPAAFTPEPARLRDALPQSPRQLNRKQRRAAARHALRSR